MKATAGIAVSGDSLSASLLGTLQSEGIRLILSQNSASGSFACGKSDEAVSVIKQRDCQHSRSASKQ